MAESSLSLTKTDIRTALCELAGWGRDYTAISAKDQARIDWAIRSGERNFYFAPINPLNGGQVHLWSFLRPVTQLVTTDTYETGTVAISANSTLVALSDGTWPTLTTFSDYELVIADERYPMASRTSNSVAVLGSAWPRASVTGVSYKLHRYLYTLPDDFGNLESPLVYMDSQRSEDIRLVGEGRVRELLMRELCYGRPTHAAITAKSSDGTGGQRFQVMFYPIPDDVYRISYKYQILPSSITDSSPSRPYPMGGAIHAETLLKACMGELERLLNDAPGTYADDYQRLLQASINQDIDISAPDSITRRDKNTWGRQRDISATKVYIDGVEI